MFVSCTVFVFQVDVSATGRSPVQRSPTDCGVCVWVWSSENKEPRHLLWVGRRGKDCERTLYCELPYISPLAARLVTSRFLFSCSHIRHPDRSLPSCSALRCLYASKLSECICHLPLFRGFIVLSASYIFLLFSLLCHPVFSSLLFFLVQMTRIFFSYPLIYLFMILCGVFIFKFLLPFSSSTSAEAISPCPPRHLPVLVAGVSLQTLNAWSTYRCLYIAMHLTFLSVHQVSQFHTRFFSVRFVSFSCGSSVGIISAVCTT
jgi:hypothetical protein